ncbi:hypothetical protein ONZ43_g7272 [Nemania bipapillata]|uniref:Uncharacterized protein n=1 Tax=Nemania bipapillata TaxID=110536 RepID=A0ACC2HS31_9PEZI|nr:hypothetical protein ONZ43_g7272 [Nemania bipapillata]
MAAGASKITGVVVFVFVPLQFASVAKYYLLPLDWFKTSTSGRHLVFLPGLLVSGEGGNAGNAEAEYEANFTARFLNKVNVAGQRVGLL